MDLDDVAAIALALPGVTETENERRQRGWSVADKGFAWERPYSKADLKRFGDETPPSLPIVAIRTGGLVEKEAVLASSSDSVFTIPHFNGYAAVLIELGTVEEAELRDILVDSWLAYAKPDQIAAYESGQDGSRPTT